MQKKDQEKINNACKRLESYSVEEKDQLKSLILRKTEEKTKNRFSNEELDIKSEKQKLSETKPRLEDLWRLTSVNNTLRRTPSDYEAIFTQEYYQQIYRLNGWTYSGKIYKKPHKVAIYTSEVIYHRFSSEILPILRMVNPTFVFGYRKFKHHQYLTSGARIKLSQFISEATNLMMDCSNWYEFRIRYYHAYGVPYQIKLAL